LSCIDGESVGDPLEDRALVFGFCDSHACRFEFVTLCPESGEELSDVAAFRTTHVQEGLTQVSLRILALRHKEDADDIPLFFHSGVFLHVHGQLVWKSLAQETLRDGVVTNPLLALRFLSVCGVVRVLGDGPSVGTIKIAPSASQRHRSMEAEGEGRPVGTF